MVFFGPHPMLPISQPGIKSTDGAVWEGRDKSNERKAGGLH